MSLVLQSSGGGQVTLQEPSTASNFTISLPEETGTALTNASDLTTQVKTATNASGSAPIYACRAWVNFNGTGVVAIRASANVSSITDNGTGDYTINFTTAMPDANYAMTNGGGNFNNGGGHDGIVFSEVAVSGTRSTTQLRVTSKQVGTTNPSDIVFANFAFFR